MAGKKTYKLGGQNFATQAAAKQAVQDILHGTNVGDDVPAQHFEFLMDVLAMHTEADEKIGAGVASFFVQRTSHGSRGIHLRRHDGSETEWSYLHCFTPRTNRANAMQAFSQELEDIKMAYRDQRYAGRDTIPCDETGRDAPNAHSFIVHRNPEFGALVENFLRNLSVDIEDVKVNATTDGDATTRLADRNLARRWLAHHREHANMRIVAMPPRRGHIVIDT